MRVRFGDRGDENLDQQLEIFRGSLADILRENHIEPYDFAPGHVIGIDDRARIRIVETDDGGSPNGEQSILATLHVGYICHDSSDEPTILRKAEVRATGE